MQLHDLVDKLEREVDILSQMAHTDRDDEDHYRLTVDQAKRVRRASTLVVKALAKERDEIATAPGGYKQ